MHRESALALVGGIIKMLTSLAIGVFVIWSLYWGGNTDLGLFSGLFAFVFVVLGMGLLSQVPFGTTLMPILFEWYWHDIPFWGFSAVAWILVCASMLGNILIFLGVYLDSRSDLHL